MTLGPCAGALLVVEFHPSSQVKVRNNFLKIIMAMSAGRWNCISEWESLDVPQVNDNTQPPVSGRLHFSVVLSGGIIQETIPAPGSFAKFKGSVLAGNPSPSESISNSQHEKQYACVCIKSLILRNALGSSQAPHFWDGTIHHQAWFLLSTPCRNIPNSLCHQACDFHWLPNSHERTERK